MMAERRLFTATFTRLSNGWVRIGMVGALSHVEVPASVILSPTEWAQVVTDMGVAPVQEGLAPT